MPGLPSFGDNSSEDETLFAEYEQFDAEYIPDPGMFLSGTDQLKGQAHVEFHLLTKEIFEDRGVYDMTFGYNLARLNLDRRHPEAGYRYGEEGGENAVLRAEFTPTTEFCPQSDTLTKGSFRAWNDLRDRHGYDIVRVRVDRMHHRASEINAALEALEEHFEKTGTVAQVPDEGSDSTNGPGCGEGSETTSRGYGPNAPF